MNLYDVDDEYNIGAAVFKRDKLMNTSYGAGDSFLVLSSREVWNEKKRRDRNEYQFYFAELIIYGMLPQVYIGL